LGIRQEAMEVFMKYRWPGNVRELENIIERLIILADEPYISLEELPGFMREEALAFQKEDLDFNILSEDNIEIMCDKEFQERNEDDLIKNLLKG
jgi:DNA-binding NtrC family response regulator